MTRPALPPIDSRVIDPLQIFHRAVSFHEQGRLWEAEQLYAAVLKADQGHFDALLRLGIIRLQQGRFDDAARLLRKCIKRDRTSADAHHSLACALTGIGRGDEAVRHYQAALTLRPDFPEAHNNLGHQLQALGRCHEAITCYEKALAIRPQYAEAHNNLGNTLHLLGRSEEAIGHYRKALAIRPDYAEAHFNMGISLSALGRNEEAISHYQKAIAIRPNYAEAHNSLANALDLVRRHEEAIAEYEKAIAIRPDYTDARINLGTALWELGRQEEAIPHYEKVASGLSDYVETLKNRDDVLTVALALTYVPESVLTVDALAKIEKLIREKVRDQPELESLAGLVCGKSLDKAGRYAEAWQQFVSANRAVFLAGQQELHEIRTREIANRERLRSAAGFSVTPGIEEGHATSLFILGPSRSGKTTLEMLVSTFESVKRGYEDDIVERSVRRACETAGVRRTVWLEELPSTLHPLCRNIYTEELTRRVGSASIYTNTHPIRIHNADLVAGMFPNTRFLCIKRDLEDNILRIYMRKYRVGNPYAYDLKAARDHVVWYHQMIDLLAQKLPEIVRVIQYEDMIAYPLGVLKTAADLCGVDVGKRALPALGGDTGCAAPYRRLMAAELQG